jgi:hypothetical protein
MQESIFSLPRKTIFRRLLVQIFSENDTNVIFECTIGTSFNYTLAVEGRVRRYGDGQNAFFGFWRWYLHNNAFLSPDALLSFVCLSCLYMIAHVGTIDRIVYKDQVSLILSITVI